ncbi:hypothetical protein ACJ41O_009718 [Fusarium nematophilum]
MAAVAAALCRFLLPPPAAAGRPWCSDPASSEVSLDSCCSLISLPVDCNGNSQILRSVLQVHGPPEPSSDVPCAALRCRSAELELEFERGEPLAQMEMEDSPESDRPLKRVKYECAREDDEAIPVNIAAADIRDNNGSLASDVPLFDSSWALSSDLTSPSQVLFNLPEDLDGSWGPSFPGEDHPSLRDCIFPQPQRLNLNLNLNLKCLLIKLLKLLNHLAYLVSYPRSRLTLRSLSLNPKTPKDLSQWMVLSRAPSLIIKTG